MLWQVHFQVSWLGCLGMELPTAGHGSQVEEWSATSRALDILEPPQLGCARTNVLGADGERSLSRAFDNRE